MELPTDAPFSEILRKVNDIQVKLYEQTEEQNYKRANDTINECA